MKNLRIKILSFLLMIPALSYGQEVVKSSLSKDSILVGDQVVWSTEFTVPANAPLQIYPYSQRLMQDTTIRGGVEVVRDFQLDSLAEKEGRRLLRAKVLLTSFDSGSYVLPAPVILMINAKGEADTLKINVQNLYVNTIPIDTASFTPFDIKGQEKYPVTFKDVYPWLLLAVLIALVAWAVLRYIKMRKENKDFLGRSREVEPPHIVALKKLEKIRSDKLWQHGKEKAFYTGVTDALREYIEKRYGFGAMEKTSSEIMDALKDKDLDKKIYAELGDMFSVADLVKFAKYSAGEAENEKALPTAIGFVNFAYMQQLQQLQAQANQKAGQQAGQPVADNRQIRNQQIKKEEGKE